MSKAAFLGAVACAIMAALIGEPTVKNVAGAAFAGAIVGVFAELLTLAIFQED